MQLRQQYREKGKAMAEGMVPMPPCRPSRGAVLLSQVVAVPSAARGHLWARSAS